eukprot:gene2485-4837_t
MKRSVQLEFKPVVNEHWWEEHVKYYIFDRQGLDISCAEFHHHNPKANVILLTGWNESFLKYADVIKNLYDAKFSVFTYDHQSQGLSGRWLAEPQSTWVHSFNDYVDDFVSYVNIITKDHPHLPIFLVAHSMGCLISAIGMARHPSLINRAVLSAPMFRNKCGIKALEYKYPLPQPIAYWISYCVCNAGLGFLHAFGFFKEKSTDPITIKLTNDMEQLHLWEQLRQRYPKIISCCVTNDWILRSLKAQIQFARCYELVRTNCLILQAEEDVFVYNRAMNMFAKKAPACRMFIAPGAYHEIFIETKIRRKAAIAVMLKFFSQKEDDVSAVLPSEPLKPWDGSAPIFSLTELVFRSLGIVLASVGIATGLALLTVISSSVVDSTTNASHNCLVYLSFNCKKIENKLPTFLDVSIGMSSENEDASLIIIQVMKTRHTKILLLNFLHIKRRGFNWTQMIFASKL